MVSRRMSALLLFAFLMQVSSVSVADTDDIIDPVGNERLGNLVLQLPNLPGGAETCAYAATLDPQGPALAIGQPHRLLHGDYCIRVSSRCASTGINLTTRVCNISVQRQQTTTYSLAAMKLDLDSRRLVVDIAPVAQVSVSQALANGVLSSPWNPETRYVIAAHGSYSVKYGIAGLPDLNFDLTSGQATVLNITPRDIRATVTVSPPTTRAFPDGLQHTCNQERSWMVYRHANTRSTVFEPSPNISSRGSTQNILDAKPIARDNRVSFRYFPLPANASSKHELVVNNVPLALGLGAGESQTVQLKRLDVNNVTVTREDGSRYVTAGFYTLNRYAPMGSAGALFTQPMLMPAYATQGCSSLTAVAMTYATQTGVDVLPGHYQVVVSYQTAEGAQQSIHDVDLRN